MDGKGLGGKGTQVPRWPWRIAVPQSHEFYEKQGFTPWNL